MQKGAFYAASAYILWGVLPLFWKGLHGIPAIEILAHRMVWSLPVVMLLLAIQGQWGWLPGALRDRRIILTFMTTAIVLSINWFVYIWAVNSGHVVETSLGYFINPLVNVLLGVLFLRERLRTWQVVAVLVALSGVLYLTVSYGGVPWIALTLAVSFGLYGLLRKTATLNSLEGLTLEVLLLFLPALGYLLWLGGTGKSAFGTAGHTSILLLVGAGIPTTLPLLLFAAGARRISLTALGILQYIAPTIQFGLGVLVYHEPLTLARFVGFVLIWLACAIYTAESIYHGRSARRRRITPATLGVE
jgi:chloramphenicol-sensitive protein RarD